LIVVMSLARIRLLIVAVALLSAAVSVPAFSQKCGPDRAPNLTTSVIDERTLVMQVPRIEGRVDIPDTRAGVLIEPAGRTWNCFHEVLLHLGAAILLLDTIVLLAAAYLITFFAVDLSWAKDITPLGRPANGRERALTALGNAGGVNIGFLSRDRKGNRGSCDMRPS
jgi:hypothetical protein